MPLSFREILHNYKKEPQCKPEVFLSVYVGSRTRNGVCTLALLFHLFILIVLKILILSCSFFGHFSCKQSLGSRHIDIISFYNEVFVPAAKPFLVVLAPSVARTEEKKNANSMCCIPYQFAILFNEYLFSQLTYSTGQIPGSPKPSPFSNLPDMSPKKVSSSHNVYVSPLRQTKVFSHSIASSFMLSTCFPFQLCS